MLDGFVPLREWLIRDVEPPASMPEAEIESVTEVEPEPLPRDDIDAVIGEARRFRAALADALSLCVEELLRDIASDVLSRELQFAPCDVRAIAARAIDRYGDDPVCMRVNPDDARALEGTGAVVVADGTLRSGDVILEMRSGSIDASLGVRLERVLAKYAS